MRVHTPSFLLLFLKPFQAAASTPNQLSKCQEPSSTLSPMLLPVGISGLSWMVFVQAGPSSGDGAQGAPPVPAVLIRAAQQPGWPPLICLRLLYLNKEGSLWLSQHQAQLDWKPGFQRKGIYHFYVAFQSRRHLIMLRDKGGILS